MPSAPASVSARCRSDAPQEVHWQRWLHISLAQELFAFSQAPLGLLQHVVLDRDLRSAHREIYLSQADGVGMDAIQLGDLGGCLVPGECFKHDLKPLLRRVLLLPHGHRLLSEQPWPKPISPFEQVNTTE